VCGGGQASKQVGKLQFEFAPTCCKQRSFVRWLLLHLKETKDPGAIATIKIVKTVKCIVWFSVCIPKSFVPFIINHLELLVVLN
jgi:hypothetical protein